MAEFVQPELCVALSPINTSFVRLLIKKEEILTAVHFP